MKRQLILLLVPLLIFAEVVLAAEPEYDFTWLDKDQTIYVLQNRKFKKAKKFELDLLGGLDLSAPWHTIYYVSGQGTYYLNEEWGIGALYNHAFIQDSSATQQLGIQQTIKPLSRRTDRYTTVFGSWIPFYAKVNTFNKILYIDWGASVGPGYVWTTADRNDKPGGVVPGSITTKTYPAAYFNVFQRIIANKWLSWRLQFQGYVYNGDEVVKLSSGHEGGKALVWNYDFLTGLALLF